MLFSGQQSTVNGQLVFAVNRQLQTANRQLFQNPMPVIFSGDPGFENKTAG